MGFTKMIGTFVAKMINCLLFALFVAQDKIMKLLKMKESQKKAKVLDCKASDNAYLHKDFHGAMSYAISYLDAHYGDAGIKEYLEQVAKNAYSPLIEAVKQEGLSAIEKHLRKIFELEQGVFKIEKEDVSKVKLIQIVQAIDGDKTFKGCALGLEKCDEQQPCPLHTKFKDISF